MPRQVQPLAHEHIHTYTHVTHTKTPLEHTYTMSLIEIIRSILYYILYAGIIIPLILLLIATLIRDTKEIRAWAKGEGEEGPDAENNSKNL